MPALIENETSGEPAILPGLPEGAEPYVVIKQDVELEVDFQERSVRGVSTIHLFTINPDQEEIQLDARQCEIDLENITVDGYKTTATFSDPYDLTRVPRQWQIGAAQHHIMKKRMSPLRPLRRPEVPNKDRVTHPCCVPADRSLKISLKRPEGAKDEPRRTLKIKTAPKSDRDQPRDAPDDSGEEKHGIKITIPFRSKNIRDGLHFVGVEDGDQRYPHVYTRHSLEPGTASCIFPCVDDPASRHPWRISIKCPRTLGDVFDRPQTTQQAAASSALSPSGSRKRKLGELPTPPASPPVLLSEEDRLMEMTVVCSGNLSGEQIDPQDPRKKIMTFESQLSSANQIAFAVGPFEHIQLWSEFRTEEADEKLGANAAKIHAYCLPRRGDEVRNTCAPIVAAADFFAPEFGRFPFESYKVVFVDDMVPDTVPATSMSLCSNRLLYPEDIVDTEVEVTRILVHALASQYFGVHVVPNKRTDMWLVVGIQWFMTDLFMRTLCGNNWYRFHLKTLSDRLVEADVHRPSLHDLGEHLHIGDFELEFMSLKAPLVLFILDQRMSKIPGSMGIVRVISQIVSNANINATIESTALSDADFRRACEKKSQYRPDELWQQWVHGAGCPKLDIKQRFNKKNLNVDITITQTQIRDSTQPKAITKDEFLKELLEEEHEVWAGTVPKLFTGPFTIRIHEADGTPYEHYLAITDKDKLGTTLQIAYNTKYKRMKRTKKATAAAAAAAAGGGDQEDDVVYFNMLGDVLMTQKDTVDWGLQDWDEAVQNQMDQESYEWIRFDCNFEWLCSMITDMKPYMYLAQLQQDRDVVAHQDSMLYFLRQPRHGVVATVETRTAMDRRYYYGIRAMAIEGLPKQAHPDLNHIGTAQLILLYCHFFCDRIVGKNGNVTYPPAPNDFSDKAQYTVQCALAAAIARTRENGRCSPKARNFLLDLLLFNDNSENEYSDHFYIAKLLDALTTSIIPDDWRQEKDLYSSLSSDEPDELEFKRFIEKAIEEIDKYRRMDEWTSTYQNIWTRTALRCKMRLMKANVIPTAPLEFVRYLQDGNHELIRIEAFDCLVELGLLAKTSIMRLLLACVSGDPSPFVRDRLFKIFSKGMASVALGETKAAQIKVQDQIMDESGLVLEMGEAEMEQRRLLANRNQNIHAAIAALKEELKNNEALEEAMWKAVESPIISVREQFQLLTLCSAMFEPDDSLLVTFNYPKVWKCVREPAFDENPFAPAAHRNNGRKRCMVRFFTQYRTTPKRKLTMALEPPAPWEPKPPEVKKIKISSKPSSISGPSGGVPQTPVAPGRKDSISVTVSRPATTAAAAAAATVVTTPAAPPSDSIAVQPFNRASATPSAAAASPPPLSASSSFALPAPSQPSSSSSATTAKPPTTMAAAGVPRPQKPAKKRKSDEAADNADRPIKKIANGSNSRPRKIVRLPFTAWDRLPARIGDKIRAQQAAAARAAESRAAREASAQSGGGGGSSSVTKIVATPSRTPLPGHGGGGNGGGGGGGGGASVSAASPRVGGDHAGTNGSAVKKRKPLPSAAPHHNHVSSAASPGHSQASAPPPPSTPSVVAKPAVITTGGTGGGEGGLGEPKKKVIKLKLKPSSSSVSASPQSR
ncbi:hypothetical protein VTJ04DRAFT_3669 [Mycothermus thermophilus]|uniref:uncharacterized protein n=1 Tax=Humicola insolens TaxID=85995 RepID=UPI00374451CC